MHQTLLGAASRADVTFLIVTDLRFSLLDGAQPDVCHAIILTTRSTASRQTVLQSHDYGLTSSCLVIYCIVRLDQDTFFM